MGTKSSKPERVVNTQDPEIITDEALRQELLGVKSEFQSGQRFLIKRYTSKSLFMDWIFELEYDDRFFHELDELCYSPEYPDEWYKYISMALQSEADTFLVAFLPTGEIAGFSIVGEDKEDSQALRRYVTCAGPRGKGIGYALVQDIHKLAKERGKKYIRLAAATKNAEKFHTRQGYALTGKDIEGEGPEMIFKLSGGTRRKTRRVKRN
jgi:GNAT superfamily N-acetyltransferase